MFFRSPHLLGNPINWKLSFRWTLVDVNGVSPLPGEPNKLETGSGALLIRPRGLPTRWGTQSISNAALLFGGAFSFPPHVVGHPINWKLA
jgi:hypothetical protein